MLAAKAKALTLAMAVVAFATMGGCGPSATSPTDGQGPDSSRSTVPRPTEAAREGDLLFYVARDGIHRWSSGTGEDLAVAGTRDAGSLAPAPGGERVAYVRSAGSSGGFVDELWLASVDGDEAPRRLVDPADVASALGLAEATPPHLRSPQWSPDGTKIALEEGDTETRMLVVVDSGTGYPSSVPQPRRAGVFAWSPDSSSIAYATSAGTTTADLASVSVHDGTTQVWATGLAITSLAWAPDGAGLAFTTGGTGQGSVAMVDKAGAVPRNLVAAPVAATYAAVAALSDGTVAFAVGEVLPSRPRLLQTVQTTEATPGTPRIIADDVGGDRAEPRWSAGDNVAYGVTGGGGVLVYSDSRGNHRTQVSAGVSAYAWAPPAVAGSQRGRTLI